MPLKTVRRIAAAVAVILGGWFLAIRVLYPYLEPAAFRYDVLGIDVSHHQGAIDWDALKADGRVDFAYIKASEGGHYNDPRFSRNWYAAEQAGMLRGAYHFFTRCRSGLTQAQNFIRVAPKDPNALPPALDAEHMDPCGNTPEVKDVAAEIGVFLNTVQAHYGKRPIIYTTGEFHDAYLAGKFAKERFWLRSLVLAPRFRQEQWILWQYHNRGRRRGVTGPLDLNAFRGTPADLSRLK